MARYHLNPKSGEPGLCTAEKGRCPFGDSEHHYGSKDEARRAYENDRGQSFVEVISPGELTDIQSKGLEQLRNLASDYSFEYERYVISDQEEAQFFKDYTKKYNTPPSVAHSADVVLLAWDGEEWQVMLVRRKNYPHRGELATPGGFVDGSEGSLLAAARELHEETGLSINAELLKVGTYDDPRRDPRMRNISHAYLALANGIPPAEAGDDADEVEFVSVREIFKGRRLAFDHKLILRDALNRLAPSEDRKASGRVTSHGEEIHTLAEMGVGVLSDLSRELQERRRSQPIPNIEGMDFEGAVGDLARLKKLLSDEGDKNHLSAAMARLAEISEQQDHREATPFEASQALDEARSHIVAISCGHFPF